MIEKTKRKAKIAVIASALILVLLCVLLTGVGNFLFSFALNPNGSYTMADLFQTGSVDGLGDGRSGIDKASEEIVAWEDYCNRADRWFSEKCQSVYLTSWDELSLHGWIFSQKGHRYAILCHGYTGSPEEMAAYAMKFYDMGFSVLTPAAQAHEQSDGEYYGMGWLERKHLLDWIDSIIEADPEAEIVLIGISMGGATVMMTAGEDLPENVKCIIEDCGYFSVWDEFKLQLKNVFHLPSFPILPAANLVCQIRAGYDFHEASAVNQLEKATVPTLFIHGEELLET